MNSNNYFEKKTLVGISTKGVSDAIETVVKSYNEKNSISWFEVTEIRGRVTPAGDVEYQVTINIGQKN